MGTKIKICLLGGEDAHKRKDLAVILTNKGFDVTIMGSANVDCPPGIGFVKYKLNRSLNLFSDLRTIREYRKIFSSFHFDIIQTFDTKPAFLVPLAVRSKKIKIVRTITGLGTVFMSNSLKFRILRVLYIVLHRFVRHRVAHTIFQNNDDLSFFLNKNLVTESTSSLIYGSGININFFSTYRKQNTEKFTFVSICRLVYEKGILNYFEAAKTCIELGHDFKFLLVGPLEENSKKINVEVLGLYEKYVEWLGPRNDVPEILQKSDVFVLPTFREGFSRVLLEACALGIPSITTDVPGTREIVRHEKEGILIPVNDSKALSNAMVQMASDDKAYEFYSRNAKIHVNQFSIENIAASYADLYKKIAEFDTFINPINTEYS